MTKMTPTTFLMVESTSQIYMFFYKNRNDLDSLNYIPGFLNMQWDHGALLSYATFVGQKLMESDHHIGHTLKRWIQKQRSTMRWVSFIYFNKPMTFIVFWKQSLGCASHQSRHKTHGDNHHICSGDSFYQ